MLRVDVYIHLYLYLPIKLSFYYWHPRKANKASLGLFKWNKQQFTVYPSTKTQFSTKLYLKEQFRSVYVVIEQFILGVLRPGLSAYIEAFISRHALWSWHRTTTTIINNSAIKGEIKTCENMFFMKLFIQSEGRYPLVDIMSLWPPLTSRMWGDNIMCVVL